MALPAQPTREIFCEDALLWLKSRSPIPNASLVASLPDFSEFRGKKLEEWLQWFHEAARAVLAATPPNGFTIFYQSDIRIENQWIDKGYLCQSAAYALRRRLLWHKIACRTEPGRASPGRPAYSHLLCFAEQSLPTVTDTAPDVLPDLGEKVWERGMGAEACILISEFIAREAPGSLMINPFCGEGSMLAAANAFGLSAIGIERSEARAERARSLKFLRAARKWQSTAE